MTAPPALPRPAVPLDPDLAAVVAALQARGAPPPPVAELAEHMGVGV